MDYNSHKKILKRILLFTTRGEHREGRRRGRGSERELQFVELTRDGEREVERVARGSIEDPTVPRQLILDERGERQIEFHEGLVSPNQCEIVI
jgi:hypothetical protein